MRFHSLTLLTLVTLGSCAQMKPMTPEQAARDIASAETGSSMINSCLKNMARELDEDVITQKFKVTIVQNDDGAKYTARDRCTAKIAAYEGHCIVDQTYVKKGYKEFEYTAVAVPMINETFLKNYRKNTLCNSIANCQQQAAFDDSVSSASLDRLHRLYEVNGCDSVTVTKKEVVVVEERVVSKPVQREQVAPAVAPVQKPQYQNPPASRPVAKKDPNAEFCHLRSTASKCNELSGVCEWIAPSAGFCQARPGVQDPNAQFCQLRSPKAKCNELPGVCEWTGASSGFCQAR